MRVAVTGGTGFVGAYLLRDYKYNIEFLVPVRATGHAHSEEDSVQYIQCDYAVDDLANVFSGCDAVIHLAARGMPKNRNALRMEDYIDNISVTARVFEACRIAGIKKVIQTSSGAVVEMSENFDGNKDEEVKPIPGNEYGVSKYCGEILADFYNEQHGMEIASYRMAEVCGIDINRGMLNPFWKVLLESCLNKLPVPVYGQGATCRDLVYVKDVARALIAGLNIKMRGIYNIASGKLSTNKEIAEAFCKVFNNPSGLEMHPEKEEWGGNRVALSTEKAEREMGFKTQYNLLQIVTDIREEYEIGAF